MSGSLADNCTAMVLAAGLGTRLAPLTDDRAKSVVPFLNRPLLDYTLDYLQRCGFRRVIINLHHRPESVLSRYPRRCRGMEIRFSIEERILGTAGGPRQVLDLIDERVLIVNGDVVSSLALGALWRHHRDRGALATMALYDGNGADAYPGIEIDERGAVTHIPGLDLPRRAAAVPASGCFAGIHIIERSVVELAPPGVFCGIVDPMYRGLLEQGLPLHALRLPGSWHEIGTPERYIECQLDALRGEHYPLAFAGARRCHPAGYLRGGVGISRAGLRPPYFLDRDARVHEGAYVQDIVAGARAEIGCGATVRGSVLLERAWVGTGARLHGCLVLEGAGVAAGAEHIGEVIGAPAPAVVAGA